MRLCRPKISKEGDKYQQVLLLEMKAVKVQRNSYQLRLRIGKT